MQYILVITITLIFSTCSFAGENIKNEINSVKALKNFIQEGQKKGYFPKEILTGLPTLPKKLQPVDLDNRTHIAWNMNSRCEDSGKKIILAIDGKNHSIVCDAGDVAYIAGSGNDWVDDAVDNDIFYMGRGDDTVKNSWGSDIFIFEQNWGHDVIEFNPESVNTDEIEGYDGSYPWKYSSFIIFGKGIKRADIYWKGDTLVHAKTGDSINLTSKEINILFADEDNSKTFDKNFIPAKKISKEMPIEQIKGEALIIKNNTLFLADNGLMIIDLHDVKKPTLLSELHHLPGVATSITIVDDIAYVSQAAPFFSEGAGGWVSIVDIKDLQNPKILSTLNFGNNIFNIAINGKYLYIADTNFSYKDKRELSVFDITLPSKPKLLSKMGLKDYSRFIEYGNNFLFLSTFNDEMVVMDVHNPHKPTKLIFDYPFNGKVMSIKAHGNKLLVNQDGGTLSIFEISKNNYIVPLCDVKSNGKNYFASNSSSALTMHNGLLYKARYQDGVSVIDIDNCSVKKTIPFDTYIASVGVSETTLFAINQEKGFHYDLNPSQTKAPKSTIIDPYANLSKDQLQTLLYEAAQDNKANEVVKLCKAGANPNFSGHERHTPVQISARLGSVNALEALLQNGGVADKESMMLAALREQIEAMKILHKYGGNIAQTDKDGCTTLHYIAQDGTVEMVQYLIEKGVPINAGCRNKETALKWANYGKNLEVIQYLERMGAK